MSNFIPADFVITIVVFYWAFLALIAIYLLIGFFCVYHLIRFGFFSFVNISIILVFVGVSIWLVWYSTFILSGFDWSLPLFDPNWFDNIGGVVGSFANSPKLPAIKF
jgi:hypothetical protein